MECKKRLMGKDEGVMKTAAAVQGQLDSEIVLTESLAHH